MVNNRKKGALGEKVAIEHLIKNGYFILETNYQKRYGEIDIIAKKGTYIHFIEVKYRKNIEKGYPREAVSIKKQDKIKTMALIYIEENNIIDGDFCFDVVEIIDDDIIYLENAFY